MGCEDGRLTPYDRASVDDSVGVGFPVLYPFAVILVDTKSWLTHEIRFYLSTLKNLLHLLFCGKVLIDFVCLSSPFLLSSIV